MRECWSCNSPSPLSPSVRAPTLRSRAIRARLESIWLRCRPTRASLRCRTRATACRRTRGARKGRIRVRGQSELPGALALVQAEKNSTPAGSMSKEDEAMSLPRKLVFFTAIGLGSVVAVGCVEPRHRWDRYAERDDRRCARIVDRIDFDRDK